MIWRLTGPALSPVKYSGVTPESRAAFSIDLSKSLQVKSNENVRAIEQDNLQVFDTYARIILFVESF